MIFTTFLVKLQEELKARDYTDTTTTQYISTLINLYNKIFYDEKIKSLTFLQNTETIENAIKNNYKESTQRNIYNILKSILHPHKDKRLYKRAYQFYSVKSEDINKELNVIKEKNIKTQKQQENWITWEEVLAIKEEYKEKADFIGNKKNVSDTEYDIILRNLVLSFYTEMPPRRNEYMNLLIIPTENDEMDDFKNYLILDQHKLVLNNYKTSKKYGTQVIELNENIINSLNQYLLHHILYNNNKKKSKYEIPLFINKQGNPYSQINSFTRLLNKIFKKNIGVSMLRHIYLTDKYGKDLDEMKEDADAMAHSLTLQKEYIKNNQE